jgi:tetratricopeptide (TPR) repeat protein
LLRLQIIAVFLQPQFFFVKKQQWYLLGGGGLLLACLLIFGSTVNPNQKPAPAATTHAHQDAFAIEKHLEASKKELNPAQAAYLAALENSVSRGAVVQQQEQVYQQLARWWHDSLHNHELYVFYLSKAAMLVNSEKNLTFAARQILAEAKSEENGSKRGWKAEQAISLFEKAIAINPDNDSLQVELGSCYVFGKGMAGDAEQTMKGIQQVLKVVRKDSTNMQAQLVLGIGGVISRQYSKAIQRLELVVAKQPGNMEAITWLAQAYEANADKANAIKWYEYSKKVANNAAYSSEVDAHIKTLQ